MSMLPAAVSPAANNAAAAPQRPLSGMEPEQYLTFQLGRETLAISIHPIREILEYAAPTDVPLMPTHIRGVINLRGTVVPVVDLSARLGRGDLSVSRKTCIVIVDVGSAEETQTFGVMVDTVHAVIDIDAGDIAPPPPFGSAIRTDFIEGLAKINGRFVVILNLDEVLHSEDLALPTAESVAPLLAN